MPFTPRVSTTVRHEKLYFLFWKSPEINFITDANKELVLHSGGIEQIIALLDETESTNVPNVLLSCVLSCLSALADGNRKSNGSILRLRINTTRVVAEIQKYIYEKNVLHLLGAQLLKDDASLVGHATRCLMDLLKNNGKSLYNVVS